MIKSLQLKITDNRKHINTPTSVNNRYSDTQKAKIADASKKFESLLTSMMLKSMNKASGGIFGKNSYGGNTLDPIFQSEMATFISKNRSLGVADIIYKKITGENINSIRKTPKGLQFDNISNLKKNIPTVVPTNSAINRLNKYEKIIEKASANFGVDKNLIKSVILTESSARENALSKSKAKGLMQLMDSTAAKVGVDNVWDPSQNILGGTKYLGELLRKYKGDITLALASYNAGPLNVDKYGGIPPFEETQNYVTRVIGYLNHLKGE